MTDKLQRVMNASSAARASTTVHCCRFYMPNCTGLMWKIGSIQAWCYSSPRLHNKAPQYPEDCCVPVSDITSRQRLRSAHRCLVTVPRHRRSTFGRRAFSLAEPTVWNLLPVQLRDSDCTESIFDSHSRHFSSISISGSSAIDYTIIRYINPHFTYLHTYLLTYLFNYLLTY